MLTPKQEAFCQAVVTLKEDGSPRSYCEAYRMAYGCEKWKASTVYKRASELAQNGDILGRIEELRRPAIEAAGMSLKEHLDNLATIRDGAIEAGQWSAAAAAEISRGKACGHYKERREEKVDMTLEVSWGGKDES